MNLFAEFEGSRLFVAANVTNPIAMLQFVQTDDRPITLVFTDGVTVQNMANWAVTVGICGKPGRPEGQGDIPQAALVALVLQGDGQTFKGSLLCNTVAMGLLLASVASLQSVFEIKAVNGVTGEEFSIQWPCLCFAAVIPDGAAIPVPTAVNPIYLTADKKNYIFYNVATGNVEVYKNGALAASL